MVRSVHFLNCDAIKELAERRLEGSVTRRPLRRTANCVSKACDHQRIRRRSQGRFSRRHVCSLDRGEPGGSFPPPTKNVWNGSTISRNMPLGVDGLSLTDSKSSRPSGWIQQERARRSGAEETRIRGFGAGLQDSLDRCTGIGAVVKLNPIQSIGTMKCLQHSALVAVWARGICPTGLA